MNKNGLVWGTARSVSRMPHVLLASGVATVPLSVVQSTIVGQQTTSTSTLRLLLAGDAHCALFSTSLGKASRLRGMHLPLDGDVQCQVAKSGLSSTAADLGYDYYQLQIRGGRKRNWICR